MLGRLKHSRVGKFPGVDRGFSEEVGLFVPQSLVGAKGTLITADRIRPVRRSRDIGDRTRPTETPGRVVCPSGQPGEHSKPRLMGLDPTASPPRPRERSAHHTLKTSRPVPGILERPGRWIGFVPWFSEIIGVDANRRAIRLFLGKIRDGRLAEQFGGHQVTCSLGGPASSSVTSR